MHTQTGICIVPDILYVHAEKQTSSHKTHIRRYSILPSWWVISNTAYVNTQVSSWLPCAPAGKMSKTLRWISGCLSVGHTLPLCHLAAPAYVPLCHIRYRRMPSPSEASEPLFSQCCQWMFQSTVVSSKSSDVILHFPLLQLAFEMFPLHSSWPLTLCKWLDGIQRGSRSWGMLMACLSRRSWCWVIGPSSYCISTTAYETLCSCLFFKYEGQKKIKNQTGWLQGHHVRIQLCCYGGYMGLHLATCYFRLCHHASVAREVEQVAY